MAQLRFSETSMKKIFIILGTFFVLSQGLFANKINIPRRMVEVGFDVKAGAGNNYFSAGDILTENVVIDFTKMEKNLPAKGLEMNFALTENFFIDVNLKNGMRFKFSQGLESDGSLTIHKDLFDFISKGNALNEEQTFSGDAYGSVFAFFDTTYGMDIKEWRFEITPAVFIPIAHVEATKMQSKVRNSSDGKVGFDVVTELLIHTALGDLKNIVFGDELQCQPGFDLNLSLERKVFDSLQAQVYLRLPIVPGKIKYAQKLTQTTSFADTELLSIVTGKSETEVSTDWDFSEGFSDKINLNRPLHTGVNVAWRPFGTWCTFRGLVGYGCREPFSSNATSYVEYETHVDILLIKIFGFNFSHIYKNQVFTNAFELQFNFRAVELDFLIGMQASNFVHSFTGTGFVGGVGLKFGW